MRVLVKLNKFEKLGMAVENRARNTFNVVQHITSCSMPVDHEACNASRHNMSERIATRARIAANGAQLMTPFSGLEARRCEPKPSLDV